MRVNDALSGAALILFAAVMIAWTTTFPAMPGQAYGSALFPRLIGIGIAGCGALLVLSGLRTWRSERPVVLGDWARSPRHAANLAITLAALVAYILLADEVGFVPVSVAILFVLLVRLRTRALPSLAIAVAATLIVQALFAKLLLVPLPWGWLQPIAW